jgi:hypothetical protein
VTDHKNGRVRARDYLADLLRDEPCDDNPGFDEWYEGVSEYLRSLSADDPICVELAETLAPFAVEDDQRLEGTLYFAGESSWFLDNGQRGGDYRGYLKELLKGLRWDNDRWREHLEDVGPERAHWGEAGPPSVPSDES